MALRDRIRNLQREMAAADATGKEYARLLSLLESNQPIGVGDEVADRIAKEVWAQQMAHYDELVAEMQETSVACSEEIAHLERRAASVG